MKASEHTVGRTWEVNKMWPSPGCSLSLGHLGHLCNFPYLMEQSAAHISFCYEVCEFVIKSLSYSVIQTNLHYPRKIAFIVESIGF